MPHLSVIKGVDAGKHFELPADAVCIGRESNCGIRLFDVEVSRRHAEIRPVAAGHAVSDLDSVNGILLNGHQIKSSELRNGDEVTFGATVLLYHGPVTAEPVKRVRMDALPFDDLPSVIVRRLDAHEGSRILMGTDAVASQWLRTRLANLNILYESIHAVSHILDIDQLLGRVLVLLLKSIEADRGCILVSEQTDGPLLSKALHGSAEFSVSNTIVEHVLSRREGIIITDARVDERLANSQSVLSHGIREAICVPLAGRHQTVGVLYFDTLQAANNDGAGRFGDDHLSLAVAVAHQAAIAIEEGRHYQALVQAERLAAVGQTIAAVSHHIKNILQGLKSGSEILRVGMQKLDEQALATGWQLVEKNHERIYDLVLDMLSYAKEREPQRELTDIGKLVTDAVEFMQGQARERGITLTAKCETSESVEVDREAFHRALLNLIGNALDAVDGGDEPQVEVCLPQRDDSIAIIVSDNGPGIDPADMPKLFTPFFSTKGGRGTGLGLAVSRKTLREHGGDVLVESNPGGGCRFVMVMPRIT